MCLKNLIVNLAAKKLEIMENADSLGLVQARMSKETQKLLNMSVILQVYLVSQKLRRCLQRLRKSHLKFKLLKCHFAQAEVDYLGHVISAGGVKTDPRKAKAVMEYPVPSNLKQLQQFQGLTNNYSRFVQDYAAIAGPLHELTCKTSKAELH